MEWHQLVLSMKGVTWETVPEVIEAAWHILVTTLDQQGELDVQGPQSRPWFHVRRRLFPKDDGRSIERMQAIRLRDDDGLHLHDHLVDVVTEVPGIFSGDWSPLLLDRPDGQCFFSFLQKLSVLRVIQGMSVAGELGQTPERNYADCKYCRAAYSEMRAPNRPWSCELAPWFKAMDSSGMGPDLTHEYAHWFGHIMSGWWKS